MEAYSSPLKLVKSIEYPLTVQVAVSKCFDYSGLALITPTDLIFSPLDSEYFFKPTTNYSPIIVSKAISISSDSLPNSLSLTHP